MVSTRRRFIAQSAVVVAGGLVAPYGKALGRAVPSGTWLPGDLHTHSVYSHDVYGGPTDDNTGPDEAYTLGLPVAGKFAEGRERGLRFMAVSDHNDVRSVPELPGAAGGLIAIPAYEHSIKGHAQMLGATKLYPAGDQAADAINAMADALRASGGVFQANHPAYKVALDTEFHACSNAGCADCRQINWTYGFDVRPDTIEVWNPSVARSDVSETYWECWLDRGERIGGTGGSDSHWLSLHAIAGPGQPTTWVYAREASAAGVLQGLREGRTTVSGQPPGLGGPRLLLSAPREGMIGDTVAPGTKMRVTAPGSERPRGRTHPRRRPSDPRAGARPGWSSRLPCAPQRRLGTRDPAGAREPARKHDHGPRRPHAAARRYAAARAELADVPQAPRALDGCWRNSGRWFRRAAVRARLPQHGARRTENCRLRP